MRAEVAARVAGEVRSALKRKPTDEGALAGAVRVLAPYSEHLRAELGEGIRTLLKRGAFTRPLYAAAVRSLAEAQAAGAGELLDAALSREGGGGLATISACGFCKAPELAPSLERVVAAGQPHLAFAAELARAARGESDGARLASLAPRIKESHRIALCVEVLVPLARLQALPAPVAPALSVLRATERHLGRWLVLAQVASAAGDQSGRAEACEQATEGTSSSRAAWSLVAWALGAASVEPVRPNLELIARLSDRPSADKDTTFLFRMADAGRVDAQGMLESFSRGGKPRDALGVRAALALAKAFGDEASLEGLRQLAGSAGREPLRALAVAALAELGEPSAAQSAEELCQTRPLRAVVWAALASRLDARDEPIVSEARFRRVEYGWVE